MKDTIVCGQQPRRVARIRPGFFYAAVRRYLAAERELNQSRQASSPTALACMLDWGLADPDAPTVEQRQQAAQDRYHAALIEWKAIQDEADEEEA